MKVNQLKAGVILSYVQMGLATIISLIYTPMMLSLLGQSEYGIYNIASSMIAYLSVLNLGFGNSYIRYYSRYKADNDEKKIRSLNGLFMIVFCVLGAIALVCGVILSFNVDIIFGTGLTDSEKALTQILMFILTVNMALSFPASVITSFITANEKFVFQKLVNMIKTVFSPFVTIIVLLLGFHSIGMTLVTTAFALITDTINFVYCYRVLKMRFSFKKPDFILFKDIARFSGIIAVVLIVDEINWNVDKFLLGRFQGSVATAIYTVASTLNIYYRNISTSITNVFTPRIYNFVNRDKTNRLISNLFTKVGRIQFFILTLVSSGLVFFGKRFILLWCGKGYEDAYYIVLLLVIPVTIPLIQGLGIEIQRAKDLHKYRSMVYSFMAVVNICTTLPLCIKFSGVGAAAGTATSIIIGNGFIMNWLYYKKIGLDIPNFWKQIALGLRGCIIPFVVGCFITRYTLSVSVIEYLLLILVYSLIYALSIYFISMNDYEKRLVHSILGKLHLVK